jgi:tRNA-2-methylthio-N6-dimethylallyladenosine synthase
VNAFRGAMADGEFADFALLIEYIAEIEGIERIRYVTSHPKEFTQRLIDVYARVPKLVNHLYLPAQHGSDKILAAMKRGYTVLEYKSIIRRLREVRPPPPKVFINFVIFKIPILLLPIDKPNTIFVVNDFNRHKVFE